MVGVEASQANWPGGGYVKIGTTGPLVLVGSGPGHCPRDGLAAPLRMFHHTSVRLHRNKFYLIIIMICSPTNVPKYGVLVIVDKCAANALVSLVIGVLKGATLGKGPDLV